MSDSASWRHSKNISGLKGVSQSYLYAGRYAVGACPLRILLHGEHQPRPTGRVPILYDGGKRDDFGGKVELALHGQFEGLTDTFKELGQRNRLEATAHDLNRRGA